MKFSEVSQILTESVPEGTLLRSLARASADAPELSPHLLCKASPVG
jgi:hypothetical protein